MRSNWPVFGSVVLLSAMGQGQVWAQEKPATYFLTSIPDAATLRAPLATPEDQQAYLLANGQMVIAANKGTRDDRAAAAEVLRRRSEDKNISPGLKRLLLLNSFAMASRAGLSFPRVDAYAEPAFAAVQGNTVELAAARAGMMEVMAGLASDLPRDSYTSIATAYFELAELQLHAGKIKEAIWAEELGQLWVVDEREYLNKVAPQLDGLIAAIKARRTYEGATK